ncbi:hypothetical protein OEZ49_22305 [Ruegeria sp. WL0004]|uniref:Uncharacterized protein n=1 Tax=Ruegeria marisflavi TaxID=2984152 RepID=A0ABT2WX55_9RHOB|nr:hypothetical protein [Ruegeria sp. WL0004]MCU9840485.1 hypothetical protein [Ruegeria sp. WL0004]
MKSAGIRTIRECFENAEEIFPAGDPRNSEEDDQSTRSKRLPQMPQLPQQQARACKSLTDEDDAFEERAAIMEYDGGLPRPLAEFLAGRRCAQRGTKGQ